MTQTLAMKAVVLRVERLAQQAAQATLDVFRCRDQWHVTVKADDSPVTAADLAADEILVAGLRGIVDVPILSEESSLPSFAQRQEWQRYWLIDPLDGTKEFIDGSGEFTVNVALIENGRPVLGVVVVPVSGVVYSGIPGLGAFRNGEPIAVQQLPVGQSPVIMISRRHESPRGQRAMANLEQYFDGIQCLQVGSSLKFCLIAEGRAHCYPRLAPTCEWDTAAAQAILEAAGGQVLNINGEVLGYNHKEELLNPFFVAVAGGDVPWLDIING